MHFIDFEGKAHIFLESFCLFKVQHRVGPAQIDFCNLLSLFSIEFKGYANSMFVEGDYFGLTLEVCSLIGVVATNNGVDV